MMARGSFYLLIGIRLRTTLYVLLAALGAVALPALDEPWFRAETLEIPVGRSAQLSWHWSAATRGYLSSQGSVDHASGGTVGVSPAETTSYVLVLEAPGVTPRILTQRLIVTGTKGSAGVWPADPVAPLSYKADYDIVSASMVELAIRVRKVLRDDWQFEIRQFSQEEGQLVFATAFLQTSKLNEPNESPRRVRRIAYRVALRAGKPNIVHVNLSSSIEWRAVVDSRWFPENSSSNDRYHRHTSNLWDSIRAHEK
jgi:hypothetical protein